MLSDKAVFNTEEIIIGGGHAAKGALTAGESIVAVGKNHMRLVIDHRDALFSHSRKRSTQAGQSVSDGNVVLDVFVAVIVGGQLFRMLSARASVVGAVLGLIITVAGYSFGRAYIYGTPEYAVLKLPFQILQTFVGEGLALLLLWRAGLARLYEKHFKK